MFIEKTEQELKQIALDYVERKIFTGHELKTAEEIKMVFLPIGLGCFAEWSEEDRLNLGLIYEYLSEAAPRSCNGLPSFFSFQSLTRGDTDKMLEFAREIYDQKQAFLANQQLGE